MVDSIKGSGSINLTLPEKRGDIKKADQAKVAVSGIDSVQISNEALDLQQANDAAKKIRGSLEEAASLTLSSSNAKELETL